MLVVLRQGGLEGGLNFDAKVRRESTDLEDLFIAHIGGMDAFARGLEVAHALLTESPGSNGARSATQVSTVAPARVRAWHAQPAGPGGTARLGEPRQASGKQERYENLLNQYLLR